MRPDLCELFFHLSRLPKLNSKFSEILALGLNLFKSGDAHSLGSIGQSSG